PQHFRRVFWSSLAPHHAQRSFPTRRSSDLLGNDTLGTVKINGVDVTAGGTVPDAHGDLVVTLANGVYSYIYTLTSTTTDVDNGRSEEHTSELQSRENLVCRLLTEKKKKDWM